MARSPLRFLNASSTATNCVGVGEAAQMNRERFPEPNCVTHLLGPGERLLGQRGDLLATSEPLG